MSNSKQAAQQQSMCCSESDLGAGGPSAGVLSGLAGGRGFSASLLNELGTESCKQAGSYIRSDG